MIALYVLNSHAQTVNFERLYEKTDFLKYEKSSNEPFTGTAVKYYNAKKPEFILEYSDGLEQGRALFFYEDGSKKCTGYYLDGLEDSLWVWYYPDGKLKTTGSFQSGVANGYWEYFHPDGFVERSGYVLEGKEHGKWQYRGDGGKLVNERFYILGVKDSTETWYYPCGAPMIQRNYKNGKEEGRFYGWFENGQKQFEGNAHLGVVVRYIEWDINGKALKIQQIAE